jgi:hypothetical protein
VGGWYDKPNQVSITQQEYRTAYDLQTKGRLRLLSFVRHDIWTFKEDTKALQKHLEAMDAIDKETAARIAAFPSKFASDAAFLRRFIDEVARNKETSAAVAGKGSLPVGNWLHVFGGFADIIDVVEPLIFNGLTVDDAAGRKALQMQLLLLLQGSLARGKDKVIVPRPHVSKLTQSIPLSAEDALGTTTVAQKSWQSLAFITLVASGAEARPEVFEPFLGSPLLLQYEPATTSFKSTPAYDLLARLVEQMRRFNAAKTNFDYGRMIAYGKNYTSRGVTLPTMLVAHAISLLLRWVEMLDVAKALAQALDGQSLRIPDPMPRSPFRDQEDQLAKEAVTLDEVRQYLNLQS